MARQFVDLYLQGLDEDGMAVLVSYGYKQACVENVSKKTVENAQSLGLTVRRKYVFKPSSRMELLRNLREVGEDIFVSVKPLSREALMTSVRDRRVHTVLLHGGMAEVDRHIMQVWENGVELAVSELLKCVGNMKELKTLISYCRKAVGENLPVVVSSGALSAEEILPPQQLAYILAALTEEETPLLDAVSTVPFKLLEHRRK